jgi:two-component system, NtrC family, sensor kinase
MKYTFLVVSLMLLVTELSGQWMIPMNEDSLSLVLKNAKDTTAVNVLLQLAGSYFFKQPATSLAYAKAAIDSSRRLNDEPRIIESLTYAGEASRLVGDFVGALKMQYEANQLSAKAGDKEWEANSAGGIGMNYFELDHFEQSIKYLKQAIAIRKTLPHDPHEMLNILYIARDYIATKKYDSAYYFLKDATQKVLLEQTAPRRTVRWKMLYYLIFGDYYFHIGQKDSAYFYFTAALKIAANNQYVVPNHLSLTAARLSTLFSLKNQVDSSMYFARLGFTIATISKLNPRILQTSRQLADIYRKMGNADSLVYYQDIAIAVNDSIFGAEKTNELQLLQLEEQKRSIEIQRAEERYQNNIQLVGLISITAIILIASLLLFRSNRMKQKTNLVLQQALAELKATQSQLIQSEKMASLGELTAGIAHEIQNPLNFVNNFSEVNAELIDDLKKEMASGNRQSADEIVDNIKENQEKINHHGKRADGIVKSMLQHSRLSSGQKELTDIKALCDDYVRLTYHGYRAKDKSFNAAFKVNLDPSIPKVNVIPQDIGRVILNLVNNAFHAVGERSAFAKATADEGYEPIVTISTKRVNARIEIRVQDNGSGIADSIKEKIFQPFFTTKPTGQGKGLGLSLSYDIVKAHGGTLEVNSPPAGKDGEGSEFIIQLPT